MSNKSARNWWASWPFLLVLVAYCLWYVRFLAFSSGLAINHDELNYIHDALRLLSQGRLQSYVHGPLLYELVAVIEAVWYLILRVTGEVGSSNQFLVHVLANINTHLFVCRILVGVINLGFLIQVYRVGCLFGGERVGVVASLFCATNLTFLALTTLCKEESLFWLFLLLACYEAWRTAETKQARSAVLAGVAISAGITAKVFAVFAAPLVLLPLLLASREDRKRAFRLSVIMALSAAITLLVLYPFLIFDTAQVWKTLFGLGDRFAAWPGLEGFTIWPYLFTHLPNLVGWVVLIAGGVELIRRLWREPRGPVVLIIVPALLMLFLGLRRGHNMAYYIFPFALFLCILTASLSCRIFSTVPSQSLKWVVPVLIFAGVIFSSPFLPGAIKHGILLTSADTRLLGRDYITSQAKAGDRILVTGAIVGANFWGPPLLPIDLPTETGPFSLAQREVLQKEAGTRYHLQVANGRPEFTAELVKDLDWIVVPRFGHPLVELGAADKLREVPKEFELATTIRAIPDHTHFFPYYTSFDYQQLRQLSITDLRRSQAFGWSVEVYRRKGLVEE